MGKRVGRIPVEVNISDPQDNHVPVFDLETRLWYTVPTSSFFPSISSGSLTILGDLTVSGSINAFKITSSLFGTSSWALNAISASYLSGSTAIVDNFTSSRDIRINRITIGLGRTAGFDNIVIGSGSYLATASYSGLAGDNNIAIGNKSMTRSIIGDNNVAIGYSALQNYTGSYSTAVGAYALWKATSGRNTAFGQGVMPYLVTGSNNTGIGDAVMFYTINGTNNTALGNAALRDFIEGEGNTAIGSGALYSLFVSGSRNTVVGFDTAGGIKTGSYNTIIGALVKNLPDELYSNIILADGNGNIRARYSSSIWTLSDSTVGNFTGSLLGTASWAQNALTASFAPNYLPLTGGTINGNVVINGTASIEFLNVVYETASVIYSSGSNQFGDASEDVQTLYGTVIIPTGSLVITGSIFTTTGVTSSLYGTASWASNAISSSYSLSSSNSNTSSYSLNSDLLDGKDSTMFATTGSNIFKGSQTIDGNLFMSGSFRYIYNNDPTNNMLFGMFDGSTIHGPYYQLFGNQYPNISQRGSAEFVFDTRNGGDSGFNVVSFNGATWTRKFRVDDNGAQITGSLSVTNGITGSLYGTSSLAINADTASNILGGAATYIPFFKTNTTLGNSTMFQVSNSFSTTSIAINEVNITTDNPEALYVFQTHPTSINVLTGKGNLNHYLQNNIQNTNQGVSASSDVVATANNGNEDTNYIDMGINSQNYNAGFIGGANDAYLYSIANNLHIGNANDNGSHVGFFVGGGDVEAYNKLQLNPDNQHKMSGSLDISGSLSVNNGITASLYGTSSWSINALTASYAANVPATSSYALQAISSSYSVSSSFATSASQAENAISASYVLNAVSASFSTTSSNVLGGSSYYIPLWLGDTSLSSSVIYQNGGNIGIGNSLFLTVYGYRDLVINSNDPFLSGPPNTYGGRLRLQSAGSDVATFGVTTVEATIGTTTNKPLRVITNSLVRMSVLSNGYIGINKTSPSEQLDISGSVLITGSLRVTQGVTASLFGTASWANNSISASFATSASQAQNAVSASYVLSAISSSFATSSSQAENAVSASYVLNSVSSSFATSASQAQNSVTASYVLNAVSASFAISSSQAQNSLTASYILNAVSASFTTTASYAISASQAQNATTASFSVTASYVTGSIFTNANLAASASFATSTSYSLSASQAQNATTASYVLNAVSTSFASTSSLPLQGIVTASAANTTITFIKGDGSTFDVTISQSGSVASASYALSASNAQTASYVLNAVSASYALSASQANNATTASYVLNAVSASFATTASYAVSASQANNATSASYALSASQAENAVTASLAQSAFDILVYVKNSSGAQINKGTVVRIIGAVGDNPLIATASYTDDNNSANTLGITYENIANDGFGYVITEGTLKGIDTSTPGWTAGQLIYLGLNGTITGSAPVAPLHAVRLGEVLRVQLNNGSIYVRIDNGYEIGELHDVRDTSTTGSYGDLLVKSGSIWINSKQLTGSYGLTGSLTATSFTGSLQGTASWANNAISSSYALSASNAQTASYVLNAISASYALSASQAQNAVTASYVLNAVSASFATTASYALSASQAQNAVTASYILNAVSASFASTASSADNFTVRGTLTAQTIVVQTITSSTDFVTGSTRFGTLLSNTHQFTGSVGITGSLNVVGAGITGSLFGTASWANNAISSSYPIAISGSTIYTPLSVNNIGFSTNNSIFLGNSAGYNATNAAGSTFIGLQAGQNATNAYQSNFLGAYAGDSASNSDNSNFLGFTAGQNATNANNSNFLGTNAGSSATNAENSNFLGANAGDSATYAYLSNFLGNQAGYIATNAANSNFLGFLAGYIATNANNSNFLGYQAGYIATNAANSNFLGNTAGQGAINAQHSNFLGYQAGVDAVSASYSTLIGYQAGYASSTALTIKSNNIIIGTNITLGAGRQDSINIGGLIFGTGSYSNTSTQSSGSANGRIGINQPFPIYSLDVSGSGNYTNGLTITGSLTVITGSAIELQVTNTGVKIGNIITDTHTITGSLGVSGSVTATNFTGSLFGTSSWAVSASQAITASYVLNAVSASFATSASQAQNAVTASYVLNAVSASFASTASFVQNAVSASYVLNAVSASFATSASQAQNAVTASYILNAISASFATTASYILNAVSASFATSATTAVTASYSNNFVVGSTLTIDATLTDYASVISSVVGSNNLFTQATSSYTSAFFKYTAASGSNSRAGEIAAVWNGSSVQFYDNSTVDIGNTIPVSSSVSIVGTDVQFNIQTNTSGWRIKSLATFM